MGTNKLLDRILRRWKQALHVGFRCGVVGVLIDFDHVICAAIRGWSIVETGGCRLYHPYLLPISCLLAGVAIALGIGLLLNLV